MLYSKSQGIGNRHPVCRLLGIVSWIEIRGQASDGVEELYGILGKMVGEFCFWDSMGRTATELATNRRCFGVGPDLVTVFYQDFH